MKKIITLLFIGMLIVLFSKESDTKVIIPKDAIRFRIIANSNSLKDQEQKLEIKKELEPKLLNITNNVNSIKDARYLIKNNINEFDKIVSNYTNDYQISFGNNYFPEKEYKGVTYKEGNYESLVVTLGDGLGDNWWCVLFPPLCLIEGKNDNMDDITYSFYIKEIINKY